MKASLGLTGLTMNAMALIAPGAFLWLTFAVQLLTGAPMAGQGMWFGILFAILLCFATAIAYAELSKLYPGAGSSYFFAEQAFLSHSNHYKFARIAKFSIGWASHLYYWIYPGVMVGTTAILVGYLVGQLWPETFNSAVPSPLFMIGFCVIFSFGVAYIAFRGVTGTTAINVAINVIQITALVVFSLIAIGYRMNHPEGTQGWTVVDGKAVNETVVKDDKGEVKKTADGKDEMEKVIVSYAEPVSKEPVKDAPEGTTQATYQYHADAASVIQPHSFSYVIIQACIAILILVGFESVTSMGEEAKNAKRDIPRAVLLSLFVQGVVCYLIQYFAANFFLNSAYKATDATGSPAPIGDMMQIVGTWLFGSPTAGWWFMMIQALSVFLALVGTTLSCISTGARVTYAMGRDEEVPAHFGMLHGKTLTPHRAIWTLAAISAVVGIVCVLGYFCGGAAQSDDTLKDLPKNFWYSFGLFPKEIAEKIPQSLLAIALASNFGTFMLYMLTNLVAIVAFQEHHTFSGIKHFVIPVFGLLANLVCMLFYLVGPFLISGMSWKEPYVALAIALVWGIYGYMYFMSSSKAKGRTTLVGSKPAPVPANTM